MRDDDDDDDDADLIHELSRCREADKLLVAKRIFCWIQKSIWMLLYQKKNIGLRKLFFFYFLSASLYFSKRGAYIGCVVTSMVVGCHARALLPNGAS